MVHENCFLRAFETNLLQERLQELVAEAPPDSQGFKGSRCSSLPSPPAPAVLLAGEMVVIHGRGAVWLQWQTRDVHAVYCTRTTGNVPHPWLTERSFLLYCVTRPHRERPFCSLLVSPARLYKTLACLYPTNWKSISEVICYSFTPLLNELFRIHGKLYRRLIRFPFLIVLLGWVA